MRTSTNQDTWTTRATDRERSTTPRWQIERRDWDDPELAATYTGDFAQPGPPAYAEAFEIATCRDVLGVLWKTLLNYVRQVWRGER